MSTIPPFVRRVVVTAICLAILATGCGRTERRPTVVVYTALDRMFSAPILQRFETETGITVKAKYDTEATKTVGLVNAIRAEKARPRCDVFWNNEIVNTIRLKDEGLLSAYRSPAAAAFPDTFRDADGVWTGFAGRARVLLVNTDIVDPEAEPTSIRDLAAPRWRGRTGMAKPLFGTTASHAACLYAALGDAEATAFFKALKANDIRIMAGNKTVALAVAAGDLAFGLTDTDDAIIEAEAGKPVKIVYPDTAPGQMGLLFIPNTLAIVKGGPNPEAARRLVDYLLSPSVEEALAAGATAQIPLSRKVTTGARVKTPNEVKAMAVDFNAAARLFDATAKRLETLFLE